MPTASADEQHQPVGGDWVDVGQDEYEADSWMTDDSSEDDDDDDGGDDGADDGMEE